MNPSLQGVWEHIRDLGLAALAHANRHAAYIARENPRWSELSVLQAAHAAELLIKARIAQEHPLLIFEQLPRSTKAVTQSLNLEALFNKGQTIKWIDLPERLWAVTGIVMPNKDKFDDFGKLRNGIQHFGPSPIPDLSKETLQFIFEVVDPFINDCWGLFAIDYDEDIDSYENFPATLASYEIKFLVSKEAAEAFDYWGVDWTSSSAAYKEEMLKRIQEALKA